MRSLFLAVVLAVVALPTAHAQFALLPYAGYDFDAENPLVGIGAEFALPIVAPVAVSLRPSGEYMFTRNLDADANGRIFSQTIGQANLDVIARLRSPGLQPYGGAGVALRFVSLDTSDDDDVEGDQDSASTNVGANLIGGVALGALGPVRPFVQGRVTLGEGTAFALAGGIVLSL